jgi:hypothetical protein
MRDVLIIVSLLAVFLQAHPVRRANRPRAGASPGQKGALAD